MSVYQVALTDQQHAVRLSAAYLRSVVRRTLASERVAGATISLALVDDATIHEVNRNHLGHDYPTDVISFLFSATARSRVANNRVAGNRGRGTGVRSLENVVPRLATVSGPMLGRGLMLDGELIVSGETALRESPQAHWTAQAELTLYIVHGLLHLCGYDDQTKAARKLMRERERAIMQLWRWNRATEE